MAQDALKTSTRTILALVQAKKLRKAAHELKKIEPYRKKIYGYDRLIAAVHSPLNNAGKLFYEAQAVIPDLIHNTEGDGQTRGHRTRHAIRRLMKARAIVRDDPEINTLLKRCLAALQEAENKLSAAQGLAMRGQWHEAYHEIKQAGKMDDSPEVRETHKFIAQYYARQTRDEKKVKTVMTSAKVGVALLVLAVIIVALIVSSWRQEIEDQRRKKLRENTARQPAPTALVAPVQPAWVDPAPTQKTAAPAGQPTPAPLPNSVATAPPAPVAPSAPVEKPVEINSETEMGTSLGHLPMGTQITLRYQSGAWRAWVRPTGFSPDIPAEGGKVHCLSIRGVKPDGGIKLLAEVPYHTREKPFVYEVLGKYNAILLRINEEPGKLHNNDGVVTYGVLINPPK